MSSSSDSEEEREMVGDGGREITMMSDSEYESDLELHRCTTSYRVDAERRQELRDRGIVVREGKWTGLEDNKLRENMQFICKKYGIDEARKIIYPMDYPNGEELKKMIRDRKLLTKLAKGIHRPIYNAYIRSRKIFDPRNYLGRFTDEEVEEMRALITRLGTQWTKIGREMGRSGNALWNKFRIINNNYASGLWTEEEKRKLVKTVKKLSGFNRDRNIERLYFKIPWTKVSKHMGTRNILQCRFKWLDMLCWVAADYTERQTCRRRWDAADNIRLIESVYKSNVDDELDIDWLALLDNFPSVPSPQKLRHYWHLLKVRYIPNHHFKTFEDNLELLHDKVLPELEKKLQHLNRGLQNICPEFLDTSDDSDSDEEEGGMERNSRTTTGTNRQPEERNAEHHGNEQTNAGARDVREVSEDAEESGDSREASALPGTSNQRELNRPDADLPSREKRKKKKKRNSSDDVDQQNHLVDRDPGDTNESVEGDDVFQPRRKRHRYRSDDYDGSGAGDSGIIEVHRKKKKKKKHHHHQQHLHETGLEEHYDCDGERDSGVTEVDRKKKEKKKHNHHHHQHQQHHHHHETGLEEHYDSDGGGDGDREVTEVHRKKKKRKKHNLHHH